jgi:hypothetical protein
MNRHVVAAAPILASIYLARPVPVDAQLAARQSSTRSGPGDGVEIAPTRPSSGSPLVPRVRSLACWEGIPARQEPARCVDRNGGCALAAASASPTVVRRSTRGRSPVR